MKPLARLNIGLFVVTIMLSWLYFYPPMLGQKQLNKGLMKQFETKIIQFVEIHQRNKRIQFKLIDGDWLITQPVFWLANDLKINSLLKIVNIISSQKIPLQSSLLAKYGLTTPTVELKLNDLVIKFGDQTPIHHRRYVLIGNEIHVIDDIFYHMAMADLMSFINLKLLPEGGDITAITTPHYQLELAQEKWLLNDQLVSDQQAEQIINLWRKVRASKVSLFSSTKPADQAQTGSTVLIKYRKQKAVKYSIIAQQPEMPEMKLLSNHRDLVFYLPQATGQELISLPVNKAAEIK